MEPVKVIASSKQKHQILYNGRKYCLKRKNKNDTKNWRCVGKNQNGSECSGSVTANVVTYSGKHNCLETPDDTRNEVEERIHNCKKRAREELTPVEKIFE